MNFGPDDPPADDAATDAEVDAARERLRRARWRLRTCAVGGPEWDAAMAGVEDAEAALATLRAPVTDSPGDAADGRAAPA